MLTIKTNLLSSAVVGLLLVTGTAQAYPLEAQQAGDVTYITGGIGEEERDALQAVKHDYNLAVTSAALSGAYIGTTKLRIIHQNGSDALEVYAGPLSYIQLPPGRYRIEASVDGKVQTQNLTITRGRTSQVKFLWK